MEEENKKQIQNKIVVDGVTYITYDVEKQIRYQKIKDILILILIAGSIIALVMAIMTLVKNKDIINKDALVIGMEKHGFESCQCTDDEGLEWYSNGPGFVTKPELRSPSYGIPIINFEVVE